MKTDKLSAFLGKYVEGGKTNVSPLPKAQIGEFVQSALRQANSSFRPSSTSVKPPVIVSVPFKNEPIPEAITIKDSRKIHPVTGQPINPNRDLKSGRYNADIIRNIIRQGKALGFSKDEVLDNLAISFQESMFGKTDPSIGHAEYGDYKTGKMNNVQVLPDIDMELDRTNAEIRNQYLNYKYNTQMINKNPKSEAERLQWYNTPNPKKGQLNTGTEKKYHTETGRSTNRFYGVDVTKTPLQAATLPYGKTIVSLRDSLIANNPDIQKMLKQAGYEKEGGPTRKLKRYQGVDQSTVGKIKINPISTRFLFEPGQETDDLLKQGAFANRAQCAYQDADGNCLGSASLYFNRYVAGPLNLPNTWSEIDKASQRWTNPGSQSSIDSWDYHGLLQGANTGTKIFAAKGYDDWNNMSQSEREKIYKWLPIGTVIGMGGANNMYDLSNALNKAEGLIPNRHSGIVVGHMEDGTPLMYDYGKLTPITAPVFNFPVTNITVADDYRYLSPKPNAALWGDDTWANTRYLQPGEEGYVENEFKSVKENSEEDWKKRVSQQNPDYAKSIFEPITYEYDPQDILKLNKPSIRKDESEYTDEEKIFVEGLNESIPKLMALTGLSQKELNKRAKIAFGILQGESEGGRSSVRSAKESGAQTREFFGGKSASLGLTRMKWTDLVGENNDTKFAKLARDLGIHKYDFTGTASSQIKQQAAATLALLATRSGRIEGVDDLYLNAQQHNTPFPSDEKIVYLKRGDADYANNVIANASRLYSPSTGQGLPEQENFIKKAQQEFAATAVNPPASQNLLNQKGTGEGNEPQIKFGKPQVKQLAPNVTRSSGAEESTDNKLTPDQVNAIRNFLQNVKPTKKDGGPTIPNTQNQNSDYWIDLPLGISVANIFDKRFWQDEWERHELGNLFGDSFRSPWEPQSTKDRLKELKKLKKQGGESLNEYQGTNGSSQTSNRSYYYNASSDKPSWQDYMAVYNSAQNYKKWLQSNPATAGDAWYSRKNPILALQYEKNLLGTKKEGEPYEQDDPRYAFYDKDVPVDPETGTRLGLPKFARLDIDQPFITGYTGGMPQELIMQHNAYDYINTNRPENWLWIAEKRRQELEKGFNPWTNKPIPGAPEMNAYFKPLNKYQFLQGDLSPFVFETASLNEEGELEAKPGITMRPDDPAFGTYPRIPSNLGAPLQLFDTRIKPSRLVRRNAERPGKDWRNLIGIEKTENGLYTNPGGFPECPDCMSTGYYYDYDLPENMPYISTNQAFKTNYVNQTDGAQSGSSGSGQFYWWDPDGKKGARQPIAITKDQYDSYKKQGMSEVAHEQMQGEKRKGGSKLPVNKKAGGSLTDKQKEYFGWVFEQ